MAVLNPPYARTLIDFTDQDSCLFTVASTPVNLASSQYALDTLDISYDGKEMHFSEIATPDIGSPSFSKNAVVELKMLFSQGSSTTALTTYFKGKIVNATHDGENNNARIEYTAQGYQKLAENIIVESYQGMPHVMFGGGFTFITTLNSTTIAGRGIDAAVTELFNMCDNALTNAGIPTDIGSPGVYGFTEITTNGTTYINTYSMFGGYIKRDTEFKNATFVNALKELVANDPTKRVYFDDTQQAWTFPDILTADITTLNVSSVNADNIAYSESVEGRYGAIQFYTYNEGAQALPFRGWALCTPAWESTDASSWAIDAGTGLTTITSGSSGASIDKPPLFPVFRQWTIPDITSERHPSFPLRLYAQYGFGRGAKFVPFSAHIDLNNKTVTAKLPVVAKGNRYHPGHAVGPSAVYVTWWKVDSFPVEGWMTMRYPSSGFEGTAYDWYGIDNVWKEIVEPEKFTQYDIQEKFKLLKDVIIDMSIPLAGDPIEEFINLQKRVHVMHPTISTGIQSIHPAVIGYSYRFGAVGQSTVKLTTSMEGLTG